jgi:hypothetical protein
LATTLLTQRSVVSLSRPFAWATRFSWATIEKMGDEPHFSGTLPAAMKEKPDEALIPTRIVLDSDAFDRLVQLIENPPPPTEALRELLRGR